MPCYLEDNVDRQRGDGVFQSSIRALRKLNADRLRRAGERPRRSTWCTTLRARRCRPNQAKLEQDYKQHLGDNYGVVFNHLYTLANMPIQRFGSWLLSKGQFGAYMQLLKDNYREENLDGVMCRTLLSVDWQGYVYDCDFNQMLGLPLRLRRKAAREALRSARRGPRRQPDRGRRPLLRLHGRAGQQLRRRAAERN